MTSLFWMIYGLGLAFWASPGPINIETVRRGVNGGHWPALAVQIGAILAELAMGAAVLLGLAPVLALPGLETAFTVVCAGGLLWIAWTALRDLRRPSEPSPRSTAPRGSLIIGALCAVSNPLSVMVWITIVGIARANGFGSLRLAQVMVVGVAFLLGTLTWAVLLSAFVGWGKRLVQPRCWQWLNACSGLLLGAYGVHLIWSTIIMG